ncbi:hypothetical protein J6590_045386 [Homalodisca vitripennis]|nr:hypothetical protein J6590_045386 [Homalodisca vitripennis]
MNFEVADYLIIGIKIAYRIAKQRPSTKHRSSGRRPSIAELPRARPLRLVLRSLREQHVSIYESPLRAIDLSTPLLWSFDSLATLLNKGYPSIDYFCFQAAK